MPSDHAEGFSDNWAYLKTELRWLDQILMLAVTRQRKETTEIERVTHSKADRATSAWWKGIISTEGKAVYDEHRQPTPATAKVNYQQQLDGRIQASVKQGVGLALPMLRDRLDLTLFEKNLILISLAPEINRRYARLYRYLQGDEPALKTDLPTVDLVLRLLCRNDEEWRAARTRLVSTSPLLQYNLLQFSATSADSWLNGSLKLAEPLVNYLLSDHPTSQDLERLLHRSQPLTAPPLLKQVVWTTEWSDLVLPDPLLASLQYLAQQLQGHSLAEEQWGFQAGSAAIAPGKIAWFVGATGTGKTIAASAIARSLHTPLIHVDLAQLDPDQHPQLLQEILTKAPQVLLLKSAHLWFGKTSLLSKAQLHRFFAQRQQEASITLLSTHQVSSIQATWRQQADHLLSFAKPTPADRLRLWKQAFPAEVPLSPTLDWHALAQQLPLTGKEIVMIAQESILYAAAIKAATLDMQHILQALTQRGKRVKHQPVLEPLISAQPLSKPAKTAAKRLPRRSNFAQADFAQPELTQPELTQADFAESETTKPSKTSRATRRVVKPTEKQDVP